MNECKIIEDLLPSYIDDLCSKESKELVEQHLSSCKHCRLLYEEMKQAYVHECNIKEIKPFKKITRVWNIIFGILVVIILILLLFAQPVQRLLAEALLYHHLNGIPDAERYTVTEISYGKSRDTDKEWYVMYLQGEGVDECFQIQWEPYHRVEDFYDDMKQEVYMAARLQERFQNEMEILTNHLLPKEHHVVIGGLYQDQTVAALKDRYDLNIEYDKMLFQEIPLTFGLHVDQDTTYEEALKELQLIQEFFDQSGLDVEVYQLSFDHQKEGTRKDFMNLSRNDLNESLIDRMKQLEKGGTDVSITYHK